MSQRKAMILIASFTKKSGSYIYATCHECVNENGSSTESHRFGTKEEARAWRDTHRETVHPVGIPRTLNLNTKADRKIVRANPQGAPHTNVINRDSQESHKRGS